MKRIFFVLGITAGLVACTSADKKVAATDKSKGELISKNGENPGVSSDSIPTTTIQWLDSTYLDLGQQKEGKEIEISYRFKNTGTNNLIIQSVSAQCGCTIPQKPEQPFAPGEEGVIKAKYNGSGHGETRKEVYVSANTNPASSTLTFRAEMIK